MTALPPLALIAGGLATRLRPHTETIPKSMLEVAGEPFIAHQLRLLKSQGVEDIVICAGFQAGMIQQFAGDGSAWGLRIRYSLDGDTLLGTGGAVRKALPLLGECFWVMYGDSYLDIALQPIFDAFRQLGKTGLMTVFHNEGKWDSSNVEFSHGRIVNYSKTDKTPEMQHIDYGLGILTPAAFQPHLHTTPLDLAAVYRDLVERDDLAGYEVSTRFYEIGSLEGWEETSVMLTAIIGREGGGMNTERKHASGSNTGELSDWDYHWSELGETNSLSPGTKYRTNLLLKQLAQNGPVERVVEIGCGAGGLMRHIASHYPGAQCIGVDGSGHALQVARNAAPSATFLQMDLSTDTQLPLTLPAPPSHIICSEVLEHLEDPTGALRLIHGLCGPNTRVIITVPGGPRTAYDRYLGHYRHYTPQGLRQMLEQAGFVVHRSSGAGFPFFNLFKAALMMRGQQFVDDAAAPPSALIRLVVRVFDFLFRFNLTHGSLGWQNFAVAGIKP